MRLLTLNCIIVISDRIRSLITLQLYLQSEIMQEWDLLIPIIALTESQILVLVHTQTFTHIWERLLNTAILKTACRQILQPNRVPIQSTPNFDFILAYLKLTETFYTMQFS